MDKNGTVVRVTEADILGNSIKYSLVKSTVTDGKTSRDSYSVKAEYTSGNNTDTAVARDLTSIEDIALKYFTMIADGSVTPMTLIEVAEDMISSL